MGKGGQPTAYQPKFADMAFVACAEGGFTDVKLARLFGVCKSTINNWKIENPGFMDSLKKGKDQFNCARAESSLLKRILGYSYTEKTEEPTLLSGEELKVVKKVRKHIPPDPTSIIFFLKNRDPERWRDTKHLGGSLNVNISHEEALDALE